MRVRQLQRGGRARFALECQQIEIERTGSPASRAHPAEFLFDFEEQGQQCLRFERGLDADGQVEKGRLLDRANRIGFVDRRGFERDHARGFSQSFDRGAQRGTAIAEIGPAADERLPDDRAHPPAMLRSRRIRTATPAN